MSTLPETNTLNVALLATAYEVVKETRQYTTMTPLQRAEEVIKVLDVLSTFFNQGYGEAKVHLNKLNVTETS